MKQKRLIKLITVISVLFNLLGFNACSSISNVEIVVPESIASETKALKMLIIDKKAFEHLEKLKANNTYKEYILMRIQAQLDSLMNSRRSKLSQYNQLYCQEENCDSLLELEYKKLINIKYRLIANTEPPKLLVHIYNTGTRSVEVESIRLTAQKNNYVDISIGKPVLPGRALTTEIILPENIQFTNLKIAPERINLLTHLDITGMQKRMDVLFNQLMLTEVRYAALKVAIPDVLNESYFKPSIGLIENVLSQNFNIIPRPIQFATPIKLSIQMGSYIFIYSPQRPDIYQWLFHVTTNRQTITINPANKNFFIN